MKSLYKYINRVGMVWLFVLFSCSGDEVSTLPHKQEVERIPLRVAGASTGIGIGMQSRTQGRTELTSGSIGIFLKKDAVNSYDALTNIKFTYGTPFWHTDEQILLGEQDATLAAYYPYHDGRVNPVLLCSRQYSTSEDLHYANFRASDRVSSVTLELSRVYSCIEFNFKADDTYTDAGSVTTIRLNGEGLIPTATLDMLAELNSGESVRDILEPFTGLNVVEISSLTTQFTQETPGVVDCLMIPAQLQGSITLTVTVDGKTKTGKVTAEQLCGASGILREGMKYEINITVIPNVELNITKVEVEDWTTSAVQNGDAEF